MAGDRLTERVKITLMPAQHLSARHLTYRNAALWGGFVISGPSGYVLRRNTGWGSHFAQIHERFGPMRVALLPFGS